MNVLVVAPHPDDDAIGCGGTLIDHAEKGDVVCVLYVTSGEKGCGGDVAPNKCAYDREREAWEASQSLQTKELIFWRKPDGESRESVWRSWLPDFWSLLRTRMVDRVYVPHFMDNHVDHVEAARMVQAALGAAEHMTYPATAFMYEVWTPLATPSLFVDISAYAGAKRGAIRAHRSQIGNGFDEAALALNHYRGILHGPNKMYVEAFERMELP